MSKLRKNLDIILSHLHKVKEVKKGSQWVSLCPIHREKTPSFTITLKHDKLIFYCQGCGAKVQQISAWSGMPISDFFANSEQEYTNVPKEKNKYVFKTAKSAVRFLQSKMGREDCRFIYRINGDPHSVVMRWNSFEGKKTFRPISKVDNGWIVGALPSSRPLYMIDEVKEEDSDVYIVEGEKCVDFMRGLGYRCVTSQGGSKAAQYSNWETLHGKDVILIQDHGVAGKDYSNIVETQLRNICSSFTTIELDNLKHDGDDVVEWFDLYGGTKERLSQLILTQRSEGKKNEEESIHHFWMDIAKKYASRSTCLRRDVGCILVKDDMIISGGWNDSPKGAKTCKGENECMMIDGGCKRTIHAEQAAIANAAKLASSTEGCVMYVTLQPCLSCLKQSIASGVSRIFYHEEYRIKHSIDYAKIINFPLIKLT